MFLKRLSKSGDIFKQIAQGLICVANIVFAKPAKAIIHDKRRRKNIPCFCFVSNKIISDN